ncbi:hypothetical protein BELL_1274g00030 [Botrytis elliptica]|uniref:Uncharacterized protein n=1 Tax=Botrytis elliptica TaxID=278938 RepID=A0A4Z1IGX4_9HELO|nr:hypothetical protein EAE99_009637 [Botrytis elliptica]TGO58842.1 hypothetical protein BELL_1274g00030 [Botrytis elliptica]
MPTVEESFRPKGGGHPKSVQSAASIVPTTRSKSSTHRSSKSSAASSVSDTRSKSTKHRSSKSATTSPRRLTPQDPKTQTTNTLVDDYNKRRRPGATGTHAQSSSGSVASSKPGRLARLLKGLSSSGKGSDSQNRALGSAASSSKAPASVHASERGPVASSNTHLQRLSGAPEFPNDQNARIESWREAVVPYKHEQQALVPFEQPRNSASTIKYPQPDNRVVLFKPSEEAASCSALVLHRTKENQQSSSVLRRDDHATRVARKHHAKSRSEYSQSRSGKSSGSSRAMSIDGNRSERQERPRPRHSSHRSSIRPGNPPPPPPPPPQFQGPRAPDQPPPEPTSAPRYRGKAPPRPLCESCIPQSHTEHLQRPPPPLPSISPIYSPQDGIPDFEREKLVTTQRLVEATEQLRVEMERHNDNAEAMRHQTPMYFGRFSFLPTFNN